MQLTILTPEDIEPLMQEVRALRHETVLNRILLKEANWIDRVTTMLILDVSAPTLKANAEKWGIEYRKGKLFIEYWLPDVVKYLRKKGYSNERIEGRVQEALNAGRQQAA